MIICEVHVPGIVPLDFRIRRILLPAKLVSIISNKCRKFGAFKSRHTSNNLDLSNTVRISKDNTNLGWSSTLLRELANLVDDLLGGGLEPRRRSAGIGESGG